MLNTVVLVFYVLAAVPYFVSSYKVTVEKTPNGFNIHPKDANKTNTLSPRIIGGEEVTPHQYPFQAALLIVKGEDTYFCGGTLITKQWVLTAASCLDMKPDVIAVILGAHNLQNLDDPLQVFNTTKYKLHRDFNATTYQDDIGLIRLPTDVILNQYVNLVHLATGTNTYVGMEGITLGWGKTENEERSPVLKQVTGHITYNQYCANASPSYANVIKPSHMCTSGQDLKRSCDGDSGGPLLVDGVQVGIVSFGTTDCPSDMPSVFTRETSFQDWIREHLTDEGFDGDGDDDNGDDDNGDDDNGDDDNGDDDNGDDDNGDDDNDDGGANTHSLHFMAIVSVVLLCFVRSFDLI